MDRRTMIGSLALAGLATRAGAQAVPAPDAADPDAPVWPPSEGFRLWPGRPPGARATLPTPSALMEGDPGHRELHLRGIATPMVHVYRPTSPSGAGLLVIPGGGYRFISVQNEGIHAARAFTPHGLTIFVLSYRLPAEGWDDQAIVPLQDAQRAMRLIRARAAAWRLDPARLGVLGFSSGGHLAADLSVSHDEPVYRPVDAADQQSAKPAFVGLGYAVTSLEPMETHAGSEQTLLGADASPALRAARSPLLHVDAATPPSFVFAALDDQVVPPRCSTDWIAACREAGVPVEGHLFERGGHGFGFGLPDAEPGSLWPELFRRWVAGHGG